MRIFYGEARNRPDVSADAPVEATFESALQIFGALDLKNGFFGVFLKQPYVLHLLPSKNGVKIEVLDSSIPALDWCEANSAVAESLLKAVAEEKDVPNLAKQLVSDWHHLSLA